jgi:hypothetical protein
MVDIARAMHMAALEIVGGDYESARANWSLARCLSRIVVDTESELIDVEVATFFPEVGFTSSDLPTSRRPVVGWEQDVLECDSPERFRNLVQRARWKLSALSALSALAASKEAEKQPDASVTSFALPSVEECRLLFPHLHPLPQLPSSPPKQPLKQKKKPTRRRRRRRQKHKSPFANNARSTHHLKHAHLADYAGGRALMTQVR